MIYTLAVFEKLKSAFFNGFEGFEDYLFDGIFELYILSLAIQTTILKKELCFVYV
jgi:hypothetical protein